MEVIFDVAQSIFMNTWNMLQTPVPALGITFFQLYGGMFVALFAIALFRGLFLEGINVSSGGNNKNVKVDERRSEDTK